MGTPKKKPPQRVVAIKGNYQPDLVTQVELRRAAELQAAVWLAEGEARECVLDIEHRIKNNNATVEPGELMFDRRLRMARTRRKEGSG